LDLQECKEQYAEPFRSDPTVTDFAELPDLGDPVGAGTVDRDWIVYGFTYTSDDGESIDFIMFLECRWIVEGESVLTASAFALADVYESQSEPIGELLATISVTGETGPNDNGTDTDEPDDATVTTDSEELGRFVELSSDDIDTFWTREFPLISGGQEYTPPADVVAFDTDLDTDCGEIAVMEVGPAYCPLDQTIYYDLAFAQIQVENFGTSSVIAVVMAHETGHHIQNLMGWEECAETPCLDPMEMTSQEFELQADCFAGAWMADAETRGRLGSFDVETNIAQFALILGDEGTGNTADPGAHGKAARRVFEFLNGYYNGVTECLTISAASNPARNGGANANTNTNAEPTEEPTDDPTDDPTEEPTETSDELIQIGDEYEIELANATLTMTVTATEVVDELSTQFEADGTYLVVLFTLEREAEAAGPFTYDSFVLTDVEGNEYEFDEAATDAVLKTAETLSDGVDQLIEEGTTYRLAMVFDVPEDASGFVFSTTGGDFPVELDV